MTGSLRNTVNVARLLFTALAIGLLLPNQASGQACTGVSQTMPAKQRQQYEKAIRGHLSIPPSDTSLRLGSYMRQGNWSLVFATSSSTERGVVFFHEQPSGPSFANVWGGVAGTDSAQSIAAWTKTLSPGFPPDLARCFAQAVVNGQ